MKINNKLDFWGCLSLTICMQLVYGASERK